MKHLTSSKDAAENRELFRRVLTSAARIGLVGALAALLAGCLAPPAPGGAGDASAVDTADAADVVDGGVLDRPDVPRVARDTAESDPPAIDLLTDPNNCGAPGVQCSRALGRPLVRCEAGRCVYEPAGP